MRKSRIYLIIAVILSLSCEPISKPTSHLKEVFGNLQYPLEMWLCNHTSQELYLALGGMHDQYNFSRGWLRVPQGTTQGETCIEAFSYFFTFPKDVDPTSPSAKTDKYGIHFSGAKAFIRTGSSLYTPGDYANYDEYRSSSAEPLCIPELSTAPLTKVNWTAEYKYNSALDPWQQPCPEHTAMAPSMPLQFEWDSSISKPFGSGQSGDEEAGERYRVDFRDGQVVNGSTQDQYGYRFDSPVPVDVRETVHKDILPKAPAQGGLLDQELKTWQGKLTPQQVHALLMVRALGAAFKVLHEETAEFAQKAHGWLDGIVKTIKDGATCATKTLAAGDYGDFYEIISGKDLCSGEDLTLAGRALSAAALIGGNGKFWRILGETVGISAVTQKVAKSIPNILPNTIYTILDGRIKKVARQVLDEDIAKTFLNSAYETVEITESVILYRVWGIYPSRWELPIGERGAEKIGGYFGTYVPKDRISAKIDLALHPQWKNARLKVTAFEFTPGTKIQWGKVAPQSINGGSLLKGGADQIYAGKWSDVQNLLNRGQIRELHTLDLGF